MTQDLADSRSKNLPGQDQLLDLLGRKTKIHRS